MRLIVGRRAFKAHSTICARRMSTATRIALSINSCRSRSRLDATSWMKQLMPIALPPGRAQRLKNTLEVQRRPADGFEHFGRSGLDRVEAWDVAAPGEVADSLFRPQPLNWTFANLFKLVRRQFGKFSRCIPLHVFVAFDVVSSPQHLPPQPQKQDYRRCTSTPFGVRSIEANCRIFAFRN